METLAAKIQNEMLQSSLGAAQRFKKRERTQNWAYEEKHFLLELCRKDMHIIENKRLDSALTALKNRAWKIIHQQFAMAFGTDRNCNRLKEQWRRMKACTRAEMLDYQQRIQRYGQEAADRKKPSQFTFEIWDFMQEAKKVCKNELMDDVDYSKMKLSLEENLPQGVTLKDCSDENDDESSSMWERKSLNISDVHIKEDSMDDEDGFEKSGGRPAKYPRLGSLPSSSPYSMTAVAASDNPHSKFNELLASSFATRLNEQLANNNNNNNGKNLDGYSRTFGANDSTVSDSPVNMSQTDLTNTLEALNILKNRFHHLNELGQWKIPFHEPQNLSTNSNTSHSHNLEQSNHHHHQMQRGGHQSPSSVSTTPRELQHPGPPDSPLPVAHPIQTATVDQNSAASSQLHQSELELRMEILKTDLETAKINRETAEINRKIALQKLNSLSSSSTNLCQNDPTPSH
ncbi:uncharacterized protein LOC129755574 [Uranotaenia lowii]|uniref:uncharacterized protein LOC129755574 n=1 Tax=Uranotaenia lowii TaxID=190385 RepID=UPI002479FE11|nr:uncharacterized protein LOC129755574 [Uranotaenia lowii]